MGNELSDLFVTNTKIEINTINGLNRTMKPDLFHLNLSNALNALRRRDYSALELTEACLRRIAQLNPIYNAFITPTPEQAVINAMQADVIINSPSFNLGAPALLGVPLGLKDLIAMAGVPTTAGSKFFADSLPVVDAPVVSKLIQSGGVILGKTNLHEIALGVTGVNPHYGTVRNPWDISRISGGSSSGSAAAVLLGMCLAAVGTDTGGSIRIPASLCGVVGLKPTYGRVSASGVIPLSWNLDTVGPITRTVQDAAWMLSVMAGYDPLDPASANIPIDNYLADLDGGISGWRRMRGCITSRKICGRMCKRPIRSRRKFHRLQMIWRWIWPLVSR